MSCDPTCPASATNGKKSKYFQRTLRGCFRLPPMAQTHEHTKCSRREREAPLPAINTPHRSHSLLQEIHTKKKKQDKALQFLNSDQRVAMAMQVSKKSRLAAPSALLLLLVVAALLPPPRAEAGHDGAGGDDEPPPTPCSPADRAALLGFKAGVTVDTTGILATWDGGDDCCGAWEGVSCDAATGRVVALQLEAPPLPPPRRSYMEAPCPPRSAGSSSWRRW